LKSVGLFLIAASIICSAMVRLKIYRQRISAMQHIIAFLRAIKRKLSVEPAPMREMFLSIEEQSCGTEKSFFGKISEDLNMLGERSFFDIWCANIEIFFPELLRSERYELNNLGSVLGSCPVDMQLAYVSSCEEYFMQILHRDKLQYPQKQKLCIGLSAAAAAAVIIVFI